MLALADSTSTVVQFPPLDTSPIKEESLPQSTLRQIPKLTPLIQRLFPSKEVYEATVASLKEKFFTEIILNGEQVGEGRWGKIFRISHVLFKIAALPQETQSSSSVCIEAKPPHCY